MRPYQKRQMDNRIASLLLTIFLVLGISAGALYPITPAGWYYLSGAVKDVVICFFAYLVSYWYLNNTSYVIAGSCLILSLGNLIDELFFQPTQPALNDYILLIISFTWIAKNCWRKY
jgi:hypothetical protein